MDAQLIRHEKDSSKIHISQPKFKLRKPKLQSRLGQQLKIGEFYRPLSLLTSATLLGTAKGQFPYMQDEINTTCILGLLGWSRVSIYA